MTRDNSQLHNCKYFHNDIAQFCAFHVFCLEMRSLCLKNLFVTINKVSNFFCLDCDKVNTKFIVMMYNEIFDDEIKIKASYDLCLLI